MQQRESSGVVPAESRVNAWQRPSGPWRARLFDIVFESDTRYGRAFTGSRRKLLVFLSAVLTAVLVSGTVMYVVEGPLNGFTSVPVSIYWVVSTMTTVGFGDITLHTPLGRLMASIMMLLGWAVLAVPTGIVTADHAPYAAPPGPSDVPALRRAVRIARWRAGYSSDRP